MTFEVFQAPGLRVLQFMQSSALNSTLLVNEEAVKREVISTHSSHAQFYEQMFAMLRFIQYHLISFCSQIRRITMALEYC